MVDVVFKNTKHLLCTWHIEQDCFAKARAVFGNMEVATEFTFKQMKKVVESRTVKEFDERYASVRACYSGFSGMMEYLEKEWEPHKEKFVKAWTNHLFHLGNTTTCRITPGAEGVD